MTIEQARRLLTTEPATREEKVSILQMLGAIVAEDQPCSECGCVHGVDFDDERTVVDDKSLTIYAYCSHCGAFTKITFKRLFKPGRAGRVTGHRVATSLGDLFLDIHMAI